MGAGRTCLILLFPMLASVATIAFAVVTFFGSYKNAWGLRDVYFMKLDLSGLKVSGLSVGNIAEQLGASLVYQVGSNGYCYGSKDSNGSTNIEGCKTPMTPFWFDLVGLIESTSAGSILKRISLPSEITEYESVLKKASYAMWSCWIATMGLAGLTILSGFFSFASRAGSCFTAFMALLMFAASLIAAGCATGIYKVYSNRFNDNLDSLGITASLGRTGLVLAWVTCLVALITTLLWVFSICCGSTRRKQRMVHEEKEPFIGDVPGRHVHQGAEY